MKKMSIFAAAFVFYLTSYLSIAQEPYLVFLPLGNDGIAPAKVLKDHKYIESLPIDGVVMAGHAVVSEDKLGIVYNNVWSNQKSLQYAQVSNRKDPVISTKYKSEMITISADSFIVGYGSTQHKVFIPAYKIGKYEVTRSEFRKFIEAGGYQNKKYWSDEGWKWKESNKSTQPNYWKEEQDWATGKFIQTDDFPVIGVCHYAAEAYCRWAEVRLPTEAEWEKAASWDEKRQHKNLYPWGDLSDPEMSNNIEDSNPAGGGYKKFQTAPVGSYPADKSAYGCMDMAGNATEWCADWYKSYPNTFFMDGTNVDRALRGGCAWSSSPGQNTGRGYNKPYKEDWNYYGFRVAMSIGKDELNAKPEVKWIYPGEMVTIPVGRFLMGNTERGDDLPYKALDWESPQHWVSLPAFQIGKYEVTRGEYRKFLEAGCYKDPKYWTKEGWDWLMANPWRVEPGWWNAGKETDNLPVVGVMHYEAEAYCRWAGGRLPTEAEWEKAARWDEKNQHANIYPWGDEYIIDNSQSDKLLTPHKDYQCLPVGSRQQDKSPYGCMDMAGNVNEWVADWIKSYPGSNHPFNYTNGQRSMRSWFGQIGKGDSRYYRCSNRNCGIMDLNTAIISSGFRIAHDWN